MVILRGVHPHLTTLAQRTDRAMRTMSARGTAIGIYNDLLAALSRPRAKSDVQESVFATMSTRPGWTRVGPRQFLHCFGKRQAAIRFPAEADLLEMMSLATTTEVHVLLADCDWPLLRHFQDLAARELQCMWEQDGRRVTPPRSRKL